MLLGVDALLDMARTVVNLLGNCLATAVMARWEGEFPNQDPEGRRYEWIDGEVQGERSHVHDGYLALPAKGSGPGVIVVQEWWGLVDHIKTLADRFAAEGFVALAPDLFHGERTTSPDQAGKLLMALNIAQAGKDMRGAAEYLRVSDLLKPKKVAVLGFCMGGQLALYAAQEHPDVINAAVDFYGIHPKVEIVPAKVRVPVLGHFAIRDKGVPLDAVWAIAAVRRGRRQFRGARVRRRPRLFQRHATASLRRGRGDAGVFANADLLAYRAWLMLGARRARPALFRALEHLRDEIAR